MSFTLIQISLGEKPVGRILFVSTEGVFLLRVVVGLGVVRLGCKESGVPAERDFALLYFLVVLNRSKELEVDGREEYIRDEVVV